MMVLDSGETAAIEYIFSMKNSHVDIIGYPMNLAAKITSLENIYLGEHKQGVNYIYNH
jgi:hypothetical protein